MKFFFSQISLFSFCFHIIVWYIQIDSIVECVGSVVCWLCESTSVPVCFLKTDLALFPASFQSTLSRWTRNLSQNKQPFVMTRTMEVVNILLSLTTSANLNNKISSQIIFSIGLIGFYWTYKTFLWIFMTEYRDKT